MKILRAVNRRGFSLGTAGWFTVLKPNTWFAASRLRDGRPYSSGRAKSIAGPGSENLKAPSLIVNLSTYDSGLVRMALTFLVAIAITAALLWWIMSEAAPNNY